MRPSSSRWRTIAAIVSGILAGLIIFLFYISKAYSYISDNPSTCTNCHIMAPQYVTWFHGSHRENTNCNDCHVPHNNVFNKYLFKAKDGMRHATIFALRMEPQVIFIKDAGKKVVQDNCMRCHKQLFSNRKGYNDNIELCLKNKKQCTTCHTEVPHGRVNSLSSAPYARVPLPSSPVPEWMDKMINNDKK